MSRYKVYNKDADFFQDTQTGAMYLLKCTTYKKGAPDPDILVEQLVQALNDKELGPAELTKAEWDEIHNRRVIAAIKLVRSRLNISLVEAKRVVDQNRFKQ